jgi:micrococcal nuclease
VFDKYKLNKIKGDDLFYAHFIKTIEEVCNVDLMGLKENKITKPTLSYKVNEVTDGDTVKITKNGEEIKVRLVDIDCFETSANPRGKWQAEHYNKSINEVISLGNQSKEILQDFVNQQADGKVVLVDRGKDKYKRTLGVLYIDGVNVNDYMLQYGKCEKYVPRKN